jgi:dihydroflavonol-4-reductase
LITGVILTAEKGKSKQIYHLAGKEALTVRQIVETIASVTETAIPNFTLPLLPVKCMAWTLEKVFRLFKKEAPLTIGKLAFFIHPKPISIQKAENKLGYAPRIDFHTGMAKTITWYKQHRWL